MSVPSRIVGFAGHRKVENSGLVASQIKAALDLVGRQANVPLAAISSIAMGADTLFAETVLDQEIPWTLFLPFPEKLFFQFPNFPDATGRRSRRAMQRAQRIVVTGNPPGNTASRHEAYLECNRCLVEECDVLIAVWDGLPGQPGGTGSAINHARALGRPVVLVDAATGGLSCENLDQLRHRPSRLEELDAPEQIRLWFKTHTAQAKSLRPQSINLNVLLVALHQFATWVAVGTLIWIAHDALHHPDIVRPEHEWEPAALLEVAALAISLTLPSFLHRHNSAWTQQRLQAEILRIARTIWQIPDAVKVLDALRVPAFEQLQAELHQLRLQDETAKAALDVFKSDYMRFRLRDQLAYYREHAERAREGYERRHRVALSSTITAIVLGLCFGLGAVAESWPGRDYLKFFASSLPLLAATLLASISAHDLRRRIARYTEMSFFLQTANRRLALAPDWPRMNEVVIDIERRILFEIWEWSAVARYSASH